jgi:hypothetical protein
MGPPNLQEGIQYVCFSGDQGFNGWLPTEHDLTTYVKREASLLSRFQLRLVNLEGPLPGLSGSPGDRRIDDVLLHSLAAAGYDVVGRANNHGLDLGPEGVRYTEQRLANAGLPTLGERRFPVFHWRVGNSRIDICAMADVMDYPDPDHLIVMIDEEGLALVAKETAGAAFRIAFAHIGSASRFVSPHERAQVDRLLNAGFDLVVCTGSHFIKGFVLEKGRPVAYGIGDHMTSLVYTRTDTEPVGMHLVAGFVGNRLAQVFAVPFHNDFRGGRVGPLDDAAFREFVTTLQERSVSDASKYYSDQRALKGVVDGIKGLRISELTRLRPRHLIYGARIVVQQRPWWIATVGVLLVAALAAVLFRRRSRRLRKEEEKA